MKYLLLLAWLCLPASLWAQPTGEFQKILAAALVHPCLHSFLPRDSLGHPSLRAILANNQVPGLSALPWAGQDLPVIPGRAEGAPPGYVLLLRLRWHGTRAKLRLACGPSVQARLHLRYLPDQGWIARRAMVWRRVVNLRGRQGTQFCWDF